MLIQDKMNNGLFGCAMTWILEILPYLKKHELYPEWDIDTVCYGKIIPLLIIPIRISKTEKIVTLLELKQKYSHKYSDFETANKFFFDYFTISPVVSNRVEQYKSQFIGKTLGIHYRGTDKMNNECTYISPDDFLHNVVCFLSKHTYHTIMIITDEQDFLDKIIFDHYNVIVTDSKKSKNSKPLHFQNNTILDAMDAMVDSLLLSKCDYVIKTSSCLSDWVKIWNPSIEVYNVNHFNYDWFPQAFIPFKTYINS